MQTTLSHYRILEQIGSGGMGVVYRAHDERLDRDVALKVLSPGTLVEASAHKRFHKEALTLSKLNHPNIATVHDFDTQDGIDFLVEEFIEGLSLDAMLASGPLPEKEIINLSSQLAEGLAAAHEHGVIHRDLKPANVRVTPDARLKILDFGLAMILRETTPTAITESLSEIKTGGGTLPYMAPEQLLGSKLDARTDIWAAGCVLYEMATGRRPFAGSGPALTEEILHRPPAAVSKLNPEISAALDGVIQKCLDKEPGKRYQSAREIAVDLRRAVSAPMSPGIRVRWKRSFTVLAVVVTAVVIGIGIRQQSSLDRFSSRKHVAAVTPGQAVPYESYLAGLKQLERWDKPSNLESAIRLFEQAVKADPGFALRFSALGEAYWAKYRLEHDPRWLDQAERNCRRAAELNSQLPAVYVTLARVHNGKGQYNLALQEIQQALKLDPRDTDALLGEAAVYASMGRQGDAESTYQKAAALRPQHWGGYYELGVFYYRQQRYADAAGAFQRVLEITPDNAMAHATLGGMLQLAGKDAKAEKHLRQSIELQVSYAAYTNLGVLYYRQRRWAESVAMTRKALEINANDWRAWSNLRLGYEWLNRKSEAEQAFRKELARLEETAKITADDAEVQGELGLLYSKLKLRERALPRIEAALALSPEDPSVLVCAGEAYENLGDRTRALKLVTQALAKGWTIAQLENDPGQQQLLRDPRFRESVRELTNRPSPAQRNPDGQAGP
jgi:serine/threonine protein kinase/tetratricopeptide (TPR) repeat protein